MSEPQAAAAQPKPVRTAYLLYIVGVVLGLIGVVVTLVSLPQLIDVAVQEAARSTAGQDTGGVDVEGVARGVAIGSAAFATVLAVAFAVLTIVFARKMRAGRNWARIVLAVFAGLHLPGLLGLASPGTLPAVAAITVLEAVAVVVAAVLTFLPESNAWFRSLRPVRQPF